MPQLFDPIGDFMITKFVLLRVEMEKEDPDFAEKAAGRVYNMYGSCDVIAPALELPLQHGCMTMEAEFTRQQAIAIQSTAYAAGRRDEAESRL